jgi:hypothetical protein
MMAMAQRRISSSRPERSAFSARPSQRMRSSSGITRSLQTMVDSAMVSTMTMPVAADSPPMKTNRQALLLVGHRQGQHEGVGVDRRPESAAGRPARPAARTG